MNQPALPLQSPLRHGYYYRVTLSNGMYAIARWNADKQQWERMEPDGHSFSV